jgi:malonyl-CoA reductase / 3-hydroxypropionate dehydrogenase (NADP+)
LVILKSAPIRANPRNLRLIGLSLSSKENSMSYMQSEALYRHIQGMHQDKVALITGGSVGIGAEMARLLVLSGARVLVAARQAAPLEQLRERIVAELRAAGIAEPESRIAIEANCDVGIPADVTRLGERALNDYGYVDYLINNAGVVGAEEMVIDMPIEVWRQTLQANTISNYALTRQLAPAMKQRGTGYVINVSSYFGGEKYVAIAYPNRSDYAVSKAGQRALVENLARFLGPEIQINAVAPGPVDGDRLRGTADRPSMFQRRARVILSNKRLGDSYAALITAYRAGNQPMADLFSTLLQSDVPSVMNDERQPAALRQLASQIWRQSDPAGASRTHFLTEALAKKLEARLVSGGYLSENKEPRTENKEQRAAHSAVGIETNSSQFVRLSAHDQVSALSSALPFFTQAEYEREGNKVGERITGMMHLRRIPTNLDVALGVIYHLADRFVSGETFHSTGGLRFERAVTEGELFGKASAHRLERLRGATIYLVGEHLKAHLEALVRCFLVEQQVGRVVVLSETTAGAKAMSAAFPQHSATGRLATIATEGNLEAGFEQARAAYGAPAAVVSTPFRPLPKCRLAPTADGDWAEVLDEAGLAELIEQQLTHHVRVAKKASAIDNLCLALVTPATDARSSEEEFALANFVKTTLHSFTATLGAECERLIHYGAVNQVDLTRRSRDEEPRNSSEEQEELMRFVEAILLTCAPLPSPEESRYRARIYRGNAITV